MNDRILNHPRHHPRAQRLFLILGGFFIANALIAEFIGAKIFSLEKTLGFRPLSLSLFGIEGLSFNMTAGVILWPVVFVMTDVVNEYFGKRGVRLLTMLAAGLIAYAFAAVGLAIAAAPADFWKTDPDGFDAELAFARTLGQGMWIIVGSLTAFLVGQLVDVLVFHRIRKITGEKYIGLRATASTLVSQLIDSYLVLFVAFYLKPGSGWTLSLVAAVGAVNYVYKSLMAVAMTPLVYLAHKLIDDYLGPELSRALTQSAAEES
ncbi:MAG: queuosine precursor transporter [Bacteroidia bacterium]|nr:queuosine precursor transporter [Bacteroidia bacterium]MDW8334305.1 queuosine precursor transporter [Bacteroidia bacterium]